MDSILTSIKKLLGPGAEDTHFDQDIIMHINSALSTLTHIGVGPAEGFSINDDSETWEDFTQDKKILSHVKTYVYVKTRLVFDPPTSSAVLDAFTKEASHLEWRLYERADRGQMKKEEVFQNG